MIKGILLFAVVWFIQDATAEPRQWNVIMKKDSATVAECVEGDCFKVMWVKSGTIAIRSYPIWLKSPAATPLFTWEDEAICLENGRIWSSRQKEPVMGTVGDDGVVTLQVSKAAAMPDNPQATVWFKMRSVPWTGSEERLKALLHACDPQRRIIIRNYPGGRVWGDAKVAVRWIDGDLPRKLHEIVPMAAYDGKDYIWKPSPPHTDGTLDSFFPVPPIDSPPQPYHLKSDGYICSDDDIPWRPQGNIAASLKRFLTEKLNLKQLSLNSKFVSSRDVFGGKPTNCVAVSYAAAAALRHNNIPARLVVGYTLDVEGQWIGHQWAEFFHKGKWHPVDLFDSTYLAIAEMHTEQGSTGVNIAFLVMEKGHWLESITFQASKN